MILPGWMPLLVGPSSAVVLPPQSFGFDGSNDILQHTWGSSGTTAERQTWTLSMWTRSPTVGSNNANFDPSGQFINAAETEFDFWRQRSGHTDSDSRGHDIIFDHSSTTSALTGLDSVSPVTANQWNHWVWAMDTTNATQDDRARLYQNGTLIDRVVSITQNLQSIGFVSGNMVEFGGFSDISDFKEFDAAFIEIATGAVFTPTDFAFDDGGTWTARHPNTSIDYGNFGFRLDGQNGDFTDSSGNGFDFTQSGGVTLDDVNLPPYGPG